MPACTHHLLPPTSLCVIVSSTLRGLGKLQKHSLSFVTSSTRPHSTHTGSMQNQYPRCDLIHNVSCTQHITPDSLQGLETHPTPPHPTPVRNTAPFFVYDLSSPIF